MGVDQSIDTAVGVVFDPDIFKKYMDDNNEEDGLEEALWNLVKDEPLLSYGVGGSYYDSEPMHPWVSVKRLSDGGDASVIDGGVFGISRPVVTLAEREALQRVAFRVGQPFSDAYQFVSVLWH